MKSSILRSSITERYFYPVFKFEERVISINSEPYDLHLKRSGFQFLADGLIHNIYMKDDYIYKIVKAERSSFNLPDHFETEYNCHKMLQEKGFDVAEIVEILPPGKLVEGFPVLKERYINGDVLTEEQVTGFHRRYVLKFLNSAAKLKLNGYGTFNCFSGICESWAVFIAEQIEQARQACRNIERPDIVNLLEGIDEYLSFSGQGRFLMMDPNPENFIFNVDGTNRVVAIDIDHPIIGAPLYQWASIKWFKPRWLPIMLELGLIKKDELIKLEKYETLFGVSLLYFYIQNDIDISPVIEKLEKIHL